MNRYYHGPTSDHFDGERFFNPGLPSTDRSPVELLRWKLTSKTASWPRSVPVRQLVPDTRVDGLRVTMVGHASLLLQSAGLNILVDPVWAERTSPFTWAGPRRVTAPGIAFDDLPPIDVVLLTHNHYDHLDVETLQRVWNRHRPRIIAPLGNDAIVRQHAPALAIQTGDWGQEVDIGSGAIVSLVPANHWSARGMNDRPARPGVRACARSATLASAQLRTAPRRRPSRTTPSAAA